MTESLAALILLCLIFFGLLQIFRWAASKMLMEYASYYVASSHSLGYTKTFTGRVGRVAAAGASGRDLSDVRLGMDSSSDEIGSRFYDYLSNPETSNLDFEYWDPVSSDTPHLYVQTELENGEAIGRIGVDRMPLLHSAFSLLLEGKAAEGQIDGESVFYNYSQHYIDESP